MVEGNSLENCRAGNGTEGSNPSPSAKLKYLSLDRYFNLVESEGLLEPFDARSYGSVERRLSQELAPRKSERKSRFSGDISLC